MLQNSIQASTSLTRNDVQATVTLDQNCLTPLCVDLDGTLIHTDLLVESIAALLARKPWLIFVLPFWCFRGRAVLKRRIAQRIQVVPSLLPYNERLLSWIRFEKSIGRRIVLATASDYEAVQGIVNHLNLFDEVLASNGRENCKGMTKLQQLRDRFGANFDYVGNSRADLPIWAECRQSIVVNAKAGLLKKAQQRARVVHVFERQLHVRRLPLGCLRIHQWTKNLLIFVPLITAHKLNDWPLLNSAYISFLSFCFCASGMYILNDIVDLESDRRHHVKRERPFASGDVSVITGLLLSALLLGAGLGLSLLLPRASLYVLLLYLALTSAYCLWLKQLLLVDVFALAALYTIRLIAGRAAYHVELSSWLLSFSMFLFLSLGLCKRVSELHNLRQSANYRANSEQVRGRAYRNADLEQVNLFGVASGFLASFVLTLYMQSSQIRALYKQPQLLWLLFPLLLYWISRIWILAHRGQMIEDPVLFAIKDRMSWSIGLCAAAVLFLATHLWIS